MNIFSVIKTVGLYRNFWNYYLMYIFPNQNLRGYLKLRNGLIFEVRPERFDHILVSDSCMGVDYKVVWPDIKPDSVIVDIGAHIGTFALKAAQKAKRVIAYEIMPENIKLLKRNISINKLNNVLVRPYGVSDKNSEFVLNVAGSKGQASLFSNGFNKTNKKVKCVRLDDDLIELGIKSIDLIKMDCEGAEFLILPSLNKVFYNKVNKIIFEFHEYYAHAKKEVLFKYLRRMGFKIKIIRMLKKDLGIALAYR